MKMENLSEFGYQVSGSSRGLNSSEASNRNPRSDHDSGIIADRTRQDKSVLTRLNRVRTQFGYFREDAGAVIRPVEHKDVSLRQWLDERTRVVNAFECLHIFIQIVEIVNLAHSQGIVVHNIRPSCFVMSSLNRVSFIESASCSDSDSDSESNDDVLTSQTTGLKGQNLAHTVSENTWLQSSLENLEASCSEQTEKKQHFPMKRILEMETDWYTSPEEAEGSPGSFASDVYRLGVLLFELYCTCNSAEEKNATMSSLRHRVFPPPILLKWPKVALFCLWLLHPEPASRPKIDEVLQSEFLTEPKDKLDERVAAIDLKEKFDDQDLLLEFLLVMQQRKQEADLLSSSNLVCSLSFDRDGDFFATAGVNKKIKVFEYDSILNGNRDIHYPVVEMASRSKFSSTCWNSYIKGQIASSNFDGVVQVWDVTRNEVYMEMREHEKRAWSVDFSSADPTLLASGSDDGSVKLWNINQGASVGTIKTKANVCSVQFPLDSGNSLAFGSADHRVYYYDLRNPSRPVCMFVGHEKTVSYVKFIDSTTLVSSSTDNTLKLWDLSECSSHVVDCPVQSFTGHTNVKNFVGLSVSDGYIATGSETNEVFVYHKAFPMPALSYKFNSTDPLSGDEVDDAEQFVSSVCWRNQSSTLVAANSMGDIKLLEMV
ncbi:putative transcription factor WD40-like family [Helianthus annuus]|nr:putative transcription factor WD40-like family [Helianthus annuus]